MNEYFLLIALFACIVTGQIHNIAFIALVVIFLVRATKQIYKFTKND